MANTTNYNWETPDDTDLVKDGAAAIRTLGNSIDTTTKNLNPETTTGDIAYRSATANTNTRLAIGSTGQVLTVAAGVPSWATPTDQTPLTTKGDVFTFSTVDARLGVGANGTVLTADSAETTGLKWAAPASGGGMTLISTTALTGSSVTLTSIPGTYRSLYFYIHGVTITSAANYNLIWEPNGTSSTGRWGAVIRSGTTTATDGASTQLRGSIYETIDGASANNVWILKIYEYASSTKYKALDFSGGYKGAAADNAGVAGGYWPDNSAITSFKISTSTSTFNAGSISLYGVQ